MTASPAAPGVPKQFTRSDNSRDGRSGHNSGMMDKSVRNARSLETVSGRCDWGPQPTYDDGARVVVGSRYGGVRARKIIGCSVSQGKQTPKECERQSVFVAPPLIPQRDPRGRSRRRRVPRYPRHALPGYPRAPRFPGPFARFGLLSPRSARALRWLYLLHQHER